MIAEAVVDIEPMQYARRSDDQARSAWARGRHVVELRSWLNPVGLGGNFVEALCPYLKLVVLFVGTSPITTTLADHGADEVSAMLRAAVEEHARMCELRKAVEPKLVEARMTENVVPIHYFGQDDQATDAMVDPKVAAAAAKVAEVQAALTRPRLVTVSAADLIASPPPKPIEVVPGLVPAGLSLLASAPKVGKSWLAYQLAVAVATGGEVLSRQASKGDVLYLALEDGQRRAFERIDRVLRGLYGSAAWPSDASALDVAFLAGRGDDMVEQVEEWIARHAAGRLVLIDTLQKVRGRSSGKRNQYELDVEDVGRILGITQRHPSVAVQVVHHDTKQSRQGGADFVDAVSGTSGIAGSVDAILVLRRQRHAKVGTLDVTGKDIREEVFNLAYDEDEPYWSVDPAGGLSDDQRTAWDWLKANGPAGAKAVGDAIGKERTATQHMLKRMAEAGMLSSDRGRFALPVRVAVDHVDYITHVTRDTDITGVTHVTHEEDEAGDMSDVSDVGHTRARTSTGRKRRRSLADEVTP